MGQAPNWGSRGSHWIFAPLDSVGACVQLCFSQSGLPITPRKQCCTPVLGCAEGLVIFFRSWLLWLKVSLCSGEAEPPLQGTVPPE